ncbi:hypothetical protein CEXT_780441 [Caerostris extrusa]|uniref:Uncharacterized protein n=1 Tax=Caerostris extrusa TaxID=172846 RepID=A0AAV4N9R9_CAEEX|nr:hypothetical protein CEXT_780441 [Caerostris extrusa]
MVVFVPNAFKQDQFAVIFVFGCRRIKNGKHTSENENVYEETCLSKITVVELCSNFRAGRDSSQDLVDLGGHAQPIQTTTNRQLIMRLELNVAYPFVHFQKVLDINLCKLQRIIW